MIGFVFMFIIMKRSQKYFVDEESLGTLNAILKKMYSGHDVVRISRANDRIRTSGAPALARRTARANSSSGISGAAG